MQGQIIRARYARPLHFFAYVAFWGYAASAEIFSGSAFASVTLSGGSIMSLTAINPGQETLAKLDQIGNFAFSVCGISGATWHTSRLAIGNGIDHKRSARI